jgi:hypothetical protein
MLKQMIDKNDLQPKSPHSIRKDSNSSEKKNSARKNINSLMIT